MKGTHNINMTQGDPTRLLVRFAIPMLIGNLFQQAYSLADSMIVGQLLGANALAAVGATGSLTFLFFSVCSGVASGAGIVTSQFFGAGEFQRTKRAIANAAYIMLAAGLIMGVAAFLTAPAMLKLMGTPTDILPNSVAYMRVSCLGVPLVAVYNHASSMLRALGDSRTPLYFLICSCLLNIVLDYLCVAVFDMGVQGAAVATIIAQMISGVGCLLYAVKHNPYFHLTRGDARPDGAILRRSVKLGLPLAMQWSLVAVSTTALQSFVNSFGAQAMAAFTATSRVEQLVHQPYNSIGAALATYSGQNYGARNMDRVKNGMKHGMRLSVAFTVIMMVAYQLLGEGIMRLFVRDTEVIMTGAQALRLTSWFYIFLAVIYMCRGVLNGVGDAMFAFINGIVEVVCRIGLPLLFMALLPGADKIVIWWTAGVTWAISGGSCFLRYLAWRRKAIL